MAESKCPDFKMADLVTGQLPWATEIVVLAEKIHKIDTKNSLPSEYPGVLGMTGLPAYFGLLEIGQPEPGVTGMISQIESSRLVTKGAKHSANAFGPKYFSAWVYRWEFSSSVF